MADGDLCDAPVQRAGETPMSCGLELPCPAHPDKSTWLSTHELGRLLLARRNNDVRVMVNGCPRPVSGAAYNWVTDWVEVAVHDCPEGGCDE